MNQAIDRQIDSRRSLSKLNRINACLKKLSRNLIPLNYTSVGPFDHDLAIPILPLPGLGSVSRLSQLNPQEEDFKFLKTELIRQQNRVVHLFNQCCEAIQELGPEG
jgi:hypothetical protein